MTAPSCKRRFRNCNEFGLCVNIGQNGYVLAEDVETFGNVERETKKDQTDDRGIPQLGWLGGQRPTRHWKIWIAITELFLRVVQ